VDGLGAAIEVRGLGGGRETVGSCVPSAVMLLSVRMVVGTVAAGMDDPLITLDSPRVGEGARFYSQCKAYARGGRTYFQVAHQVGGIPLGSR